MSNPTGKTQQKANNTFQETLIYAESEDGLDLAGVSIRPIEPVSDTTIIWIHGNTGNFYDYPYIMIGRALASWDYHFISGNTRGHDLAAFAFNLKTGQRVAIGSAWEHLEEAPYDLTGWITFAQEQEAQQVVLVGHSQGAAKVALYQATHNDSRVKGIVLASPDLHGHWTADLVAEARKMVEAGRGDDLMPPLLNTPAYRLSAASVISRDAMLKAAYTGANPHIASITCPILAFYGASGDIAGTTELEFIQNRSQQAQVTTSLIENADHVYLDQHEAVAQLITGWIADQLN